MLFPPSLDVSYEELSDDPCDRHEALVNVFGQQLFFSMNSAMCRMRDLVMSSSQRQALGRIHREPLEDAAKLPPDARRVAFGLARRLLADFSDHLLWVFSSQGFEISFGRRHVLRYRLVVEICDSDTGEILEEEVINRGGRRSFAEYWGRWLNRYGKLGLTDPPPDGEARPPEPSDGTEPIA